jgi:hypothetical protein
VHEPPAFTAAFAEIIGEVRKRVRIDKNTINFLLMG